MASTLMPFFSGTEAPVMSRVILEITPLRKAWLPVRVNSFVTRPAPVVILTVRTAPLDCRCLDCGNTFTVTTRQFHCPACESENIHFDGGHGLMLLSLRVDTEE